MSTAAPRLGDIEPRERAGAQTGRKYEYQYERTGRAALDLLAPHGDHVCVYCDWHDDYVVEIGNAPTRYIFHQVKGRKSSQGPWKFSEFLGVQKKKAKTPSKRPAEASLDAVLPLMLLHRKNFGVNCAGLTFVTNAGLDPTLSDFLQNLQTSASEAELSDEAKTAFLHVTRAYLAVTPPLAASGGELFHTLKTLRIFTDQGHLEDQEAALLELGNVIVDYSEIDLLQRQSKQIAREIVGRVRSKAAYSATVIPTSDDQLRQEKGIVIAELLNILSLSAQAYEQLKAGEGQDTVKTLSRLDRFCAKNKMTHHLVQICRFKAQWDVWRTIERHFLTSADFVLLESRAKDVLKAGLTIEKAVAEAKDMAKQFAGMTATPFTPEHALGLIFSIAAQVEAVNLT